MTCYVVPAASQPLTADPLASDQIVSGNPQVSVHDILETKDLSVGIWQHTAGVSTDVEVDEIFVVLSGRATIEVAGGPTLLVGPGDVGVLEAGAETTWTVHEDLRKIYIIRG
ncbi:MAG TPA: cupin domain-containing protein [Actinomycetes bacterium]|nr:cupin domain-containing protein [Actinomycetes bacterium]